MGKHTLSELQTLQALPLALKVKKTQQRIREWVYEYGIDHVYVSFSGGKDSTVLLHIARQIFPEIKAVFADTGLEFPEIREFVKTFDNVDIVKPKMTFKQVIEKYGYPMISKEVAECVYGARKYLESVLTSLAESETVLQTDRQTDSPYAYRLDKLLGFPKQKISIKDRCSIVLEVADGRHPKDERFKGSWRRFGIFTGTFTAGNRIDKRLYQGIGQSESAEMHGDKHETGQDDDGSYP